VSVIQGAAVVSNPNPMGVLDELGKLWVNKLMIEPLLPSMWGFFAGPSMLAKYINYPKWG